jgi:hypothetical protein
MTPQEQISVRAMEAAILVAHRLGIECAGAKLLRHSAHTTVGLFPSDIVARVRRAERPEAGRGLRRELAVAVHLMGKAAPVVGPTMEILPGPYFHDGFGLTLWRFIAHVPADFDNQAHVVSAAKALRRIHDALADFPGELPSYRSKLNECRTLLDDETALTALPRADRTFLLVLYDRLIAALDAISLTPVPIHGDAGAHNVFMTSQGARYGDFEDVSIGPREWDIGFLPPDIDLTAFSPIDWDLFCILSDLRSLCVSVWCWAKYDIPEKREAADYHLAYLKERFA